MFQLQNLTSRFCMAAACSLIMHGAVCAQYTTNHQVTPRPSMVPSQTFTTDGGECACRNIPGGYPCQTGCKKCMLAVDCRTCTGEEARWRDMRPIDFGAYGQGSYAGPSRSAHLSEYRLRPGDQVQALYLLTRRQERGGEYRLAPGDQILIESVADDDLQRGTLERGLVIQPDGTITVRLLGQIHAGGLTVNQLREVLEEQYTEFYDQPAIDVTPVRFNVLAEDIINAVGGQSGLQQQALTQTVMPDGKLRLPRIGQLCVQGMTLSELKREINLRYSEIVVGLEVEPVLTEQAPHFAYVLGLVNQPARIELESPTTVLGAIATAGGTTVGGNLRQIVIFRRAEDWRLISTVLDLRGAIYGRRPTPSDEIWIQDGDVIIVPAAPIQIFDNFVQKVFTEGIYGAVPANFNIGDDN